MSDIPIPDSTPSPLEGDAPGTILVTFPPDDPTPAQIGPYKILQKLGEGGCGVVYLAEQLHPVKRRVALKVIKLGMDTRQVVARFEAERQALAMMDHPHIAKVLDAGATDKGQPYFVMELIRGVKITEYCDHNKLSATERLNLFTQVCSAIQHAHQKGIIHRDIKPSNIMVTLHDGVPLPKIIDFGIAKATQQQLTDKTLFTEIHQFIGTPAYMSPEQAELSGLDIDTRSDIYSLGVLLYELLTGRTPFDPKALVKSGLDELRRQIREEEPPRPSTRVSTLAAAELSEVSKLRHVQGLQLVGLLRGDLDWIVMKCLEKDRTRRYETANGLALDVKRFLANEPVSARPPNAAYQFQKFYRRHRFGLAAAGAVGLALLIGFGFSTWSYLQERKARSRAEAAEHQQSILRGQSENARQKAEQAEARAVVQKQLAESERKKSQESELHAHRLLYASDMNLVQQALKANNLGRARRILDRHRPVPVGDAADSKSTVAPAALQDLRGWEWRYLWNQSRSDALFTLTNRSARGISASFSHDGSQVAIGFADGWIGVWNVIQRRLVLTIQTNEPTGLAVFSPVAPLLFTSSDHGSLRLLNLDSKEERILSPDTPVFYVTSVTFSRDGTRVAALGSFSNDQSRLRVWEVKSGKVLQTIDFPFPGNLHLGRVRFSPDGEVLYLGGRGSSFEARKLSDGSQIWRVKASSDLGLTALAVSPDGAFVATAHGYAETFIRIWSSDGKLVTTLPGHTSWIGELNFSTDGKRLLSAAADQTLRIWDTKQWKETQVLRGHNDEVHAGAFSPDGQLVVSGSKDGSILLWSASGTKARSDGFIFPSGTESVRPLAGSRVALLMAKGISPSLWNLVTRQPVPLSLPTNGVYGYESDNLLFHQDLQRWLTMYKLSDTEAREIGRIDVGQVMNSGAFWAPTGLLAYGTGTNKIELVGLNSPDRRRSFTAESGNVVRPWRFFDDGRHLAAVNQEAEISLWNIATGQSVSGLDHIVIPAERAILDGHHKTFVFAGIRLTRETDLYFCDFSNPTNSIRRMPTIASLTSIAMSPDGTLIAAGSLSGKAVLYDVATGEQKQEFHGHLNSVSGLAFSPDGLRLATGGGGLESVKIWDIGTGQEMINLEGDGSLVSMLNFSDDGSTLIGGSPNGNHLWQMWRVPSWSEITQTENAR